MEATKVGWRHHGFNKYNLGIISTPLDGNCFFHALCNSFYRAYRNESIICRYDIVKKLRSELATILDDPHPNGRGTRYQMLRNGSIRELGDSGIPEYTLEGMKSWLNSSASMGDEIVSLIGEVLDKSIYFL